MTNGSPSEPLLTSSALTVLERRYLKRNEQGEVLEQPADMFRRVAHAVAAAEELFDNGQNATALEAEFYRLLTSAGVSRQLTDPDECRSGARPAVGLLCTPRGRFHGEHFRSD
ncbi:MAG: ribonucleotide reductase N-terminal alpha domain-containing protein [Syntrophotaleaceae bacterium]